MRTWTRNYLEFLNRSNDYNRLCTRLLYVLHKFMSDIEISNVVDPLDDDCFYILDERRTNGFLYYFQCVSDICKRKTKSTNFEFSRRVLYVKQVFYLTFR